MKYNVFISYASQDKMIADAVCHTLEASNVKCWIAPRDILPGDHYAKSIIQAIKDSEMMVIIYSKSSNQSVHVAAEIDRMFTLGKPIIPFLIDDTKMNDEYEYYLSRKHWLIAYPEYKNKCVELTEIVCRMLNINQDICQSLKKDEIEEYNKGMKLYYSGQYIDSLKHLENAAEMGHTDAQYMAGLVCAVAYCGVMDYKRAAIWFEKAAIKDHFYAQDWLGKLYERGHGVETDYEKARYWYECSSNHNYADALYALGEFYEKGKGVMIDDEKAFSYYLRAASVGGNNSSTPNAMRKVADMYEYGLGTDKNLKTALNWLKKLLILYNKEEFLSHSQECEKQKIISKIKELEHA